MKTIVRSTLLGTAFALILGLFVAAPARANYDGVTITNKSDRCAWITIYWAGNIDPWKIVDSNSGQPQWLRPGQSHSFSLGFSANQMKIRAEVKKNVDCTGDTIRDTYDKRETGSGEDHDRRDFLHAHLMNSSNGYNLWFY